MKKIFIRMLLVLTIFSSSYFDLFSASKEELEQEVEDIEEHYNTIARVCRPLVNIDKEKTKNDSLLVEIACLLAGEKNIIYDPDAELLSRFNEDIVSLIKANKVKQITYQVDGELYTILFNFHNDKAKRNALLLAIAGLTKTNFDYLTGILLEYPQKDIEFYIQRSFFIYNSSLYSADSNFERLKSLFDTIPYAQWNENDKKIFENFIHQSSVANKVTRERIKAQSWLNRYRNYSTGELESYFNQLREK